MAKVSLKNRLMFWALALLSPAIVMLLTLWGLLFEYGLQGRFSLEMVEKNRRQQTKLFEQKKLLRPTSLLFSLLALWSFAALELFCYQASLLYYLRPGATIISERGEEEKKSKDKKQNIDRKVHPTGLYADVPLFLDDIHARVNCFSLALSVKLWNQPHYRSGTFVNDMKKNLKNVAIPGTSLALSSLTLFGRPFVALFLLFGQPIISLLSALHSTFFIDLSDVIVPGPRDPIPDDSSSSESSSSSSPKASKSSPSPPRSPMKNEQVVSRIVEQFRKQMLRPEDWFSFWTLNCRLASYHSLFSPEAQGYRMEDKWTFLQEAAAAEIPVSPWIQCESIVVKNTNEEGGLGIHFFQNATSGGPWIIQETLSNHESIASLLPSRAPLSTLRVMTSSRSALHSPSHRVFPAKENASAPLSSSETEDENMIDVMSCVFRAGRQGAATDHQSILFDVDLESGRIGRGTTNSHWYQLGPKTILSTPWTSSHSYTVHPDTCERLSGKTIPNIDEIVKLAKNAHLRLLPDVPMAGWDVALTTRGILLLEVNLSCNFFRGQFDIPRYLQTVNDFFLDIERRLH